MIFKNVSSLKKQPMSTNKLAQVQFNTLALKPLYLLLVPLLAFPVLLHFLLPTGLLFPIALPLHRFRLTAPLWPFDNAQLILDTAQLFYSRAPQRISFLWLLQQSLSRGLRQLSLTSAHHLPQSRLLSSTA